MSDMAIDQRPPAVRHDPVVAPHSSVLVLPGEPTGEPGSTSVTAPGIAITVVRQERRGERTVGVFEVVHDKVSWRPVVDVERILERSQTVAVAAAAAVALVAVSRAWSRTRPEVGRVTMGPGGWLSVRGDSRRTLNIRRLDRRTGRTSSPRAEGRQPMLKRAARRLTRSA